jgi:hypothetical protein
LFSCPPFWKCCTIQSYLHLHVIFMDHLHNQKFAKLLIDAPWNVKQAHLQLCKFNYECSVINSSYHTYILFVFNSLPYNVMYLPWLVISYSCTCFTLLMWTYHWWFGFPLMFEVHVQEWTHYTHDTFRDTVTTIALKIGTHIPNRSFPPFPLSHLTSSQYSYHERQLLDINGCCHSLSYSLEYGIVCIIHNNACNSSCYLWKYKIIYKAHTKIQLHSPCYRDLWLFSFLFRFLFYHLCSRHYSLSSKILLIPTMFISYYQQCFHNHLACTSHSNFAICYHAWKAILISSTHLNYCTSIIDWFVIDNTFLFFHLISVLVVSWLLCSFMTCVLELLCTLYILWMGSHPYFFFLIYTRFFFWWSFIQ